MGENKAYADAVKEQAEQTAAEAAATRPAQKKKIKAKVIVPIILAAIILAGAGGGYAYYNNYQQTVVIPARKFAEAKELYKDEKYEEALALFDELGDYSKAPEWKKVSQEQIDFANAYADAEKLLADNKYQEAYDAFTKLQGYRDATYRANEIHDKYLNTIGQIRNAEIGDEFDLLPFVDSQPWKVLAKEDNRVLLYQVCDDKSKVGLSIFDMLPDTFWYFAEGTYESSLFGTEILKHVMEPGSFIPDKELFTKYIEGSDAFVADGKAWLLKTGKTYRYFNHNYDSYAMTYVGTDNEIKGERESNDLVIRLFVWIDVSE